ncbi:electron transfer flavoprotein subunit alpha/FixB family protein [Thermatribacter velox]|jgi:electron transfer flavoprotein alpha subunit|uniref:Electron transfer flavoprotein subunit alpha/FixB family protein n=1 Tax=Thermatribacter velox TaxID=3039681 RepID=A0ABZ2YB47_9BACT
MRLERKILVLGETFQGKIETTSFEMLRVAQDLNQKIGGEVLFLLGTTQVNTEELERAIHYGADRVYCVVNDIFGMLLPHLSAKLFLPPIKELKPEIILGAATSWGRTILPYLAAKLHTGLTADCTSLDIDPEDGRLVQIRPAIGGNIMATIKTRTLPQMASVRPNLFPPRLDTSRQGEIKILKDTTNYNPELLKSEIVIQKDQKELTASKVVVSGGAGIKNKSNLELLSKLAEKLNAALGASRKLVERGLANYPQQVGLSGKTVNPTLYLAVGISGAIQHLAGMQGSQWIVAINRDPEAPIFQIADLGLVGDAREIITSILEVIDEKTHESAV